MSLTHHAIEQRIVELLGARSPSSSICPSDVARSFSDDESEWRDLMAPVRDVAARLASDNVIRVTQGDKEVVIDAALRGPIRLRRSKHFPDPPPIL